MSEAANREAPPAPAARLGGELRARRQSLGWELPDLARSLRIRQPYLEAIEGGRMAELPGSTYALGFVRAYASALGLHGEQVASRFRAEAAVVNTRPALSFPAPVPQRGVPAGALMLLGLLILGGAYGGWYYVSEHQHTPAETVPPIPDHLLQAEKAPPSPQVASILPTASAPAPVAAPVLAPVSATIPPASTTPVVTPPATTAPGMAGPSAGVQAPSARVTTPATTATLPPAGQPSAAPVPGITAIPPGTRIILKANADAWVTVKQPGGPAIFNKLMHANDTWPVPADKAGLLLTTGNAGGTELDVDDTMIATLGSNGAVRRNLPLNADALKAAPLPPIGHPRTVAPAD